jgi:hypothetical protein
MSPRTSPVLLLCGLVCAAGAGFYGRGIQAESSSTVKPAWKHVGPGLAGVMAPVAADPLARGTIYIATMAGGIRRSVDHGETWVTVNNSLATLATGPARVSAQSIDIRQSGGAAVPTNAGQGNLLLNREADVRAAQHEG